MIFLDEMSHADRADCEAVKNKITATTISYRPMGTNKQHTKVSKATLIGCANKSFVQLINDTTGNRRFAPIEYLPQDEAEANWDELSKIDYLRMWRAVDPNGPDPLENHMDELRRLQRANRRKSPAERFLQSIPSFRMFKPGDVIPFERAYEVYLDWSEHNDPDAKRQSSEWLAEEIKNLLKSDKNAKRLPVELARTSASRNNLRIRQPGSYDPD